MRAVTRIATHGSYAPFEYDFYRQLTDDCGFVDAFRTLHPDYAEHSWVGRTGDGYRYDHARCSADLADKLLVCDCVYQPARRLVE